MNNNTSASRTFTFESLSYESPQHLAAVVAEGRRSVRVDKQTVWTDLEVLHRGRRCRETKMSGRDTANVLREQLLNLQERPNNKEAVRGSVTQSI